MEAWRLETIIVKEKENHEIGIKPQDSQDDKPPINPSISSKHQMDSING